MASDSGDEGQGTEAHETAQPGSEISEKSYGARGDTASAKETTSAPNTRQTRRKSGWSAGLARRIGGGTGSPAAGLRVEPEPTPGWEAAAGDRRVTFPEWVVETLRGLFDLQFRRPVTRTLLPLAYLLGLLFAFAVPVAAVVLAWRFSALTGVLAVLVAVPLGLSIAAAVRLFLEFLVNAARLADKVEHMSDLADDISQVLTEVAEPMSQLSEDVRAVQFWRWRGSRK